MKQQESIKNLINEAKDISFFADEVLSEEIMKDEASLVSYIKRNRQKLITNRTISNRSEVPLISEEQIKERRRWFSKVERVVLYYPIAIFIIITWLILSAYEMSSWKIVDTISKVFPQSMNWSNISPQFREKMILFYVLFHVFLVYVLLSAVVKVYTNRVEFLGAKFVPVKNNLCPKLGLIITLLSMLLLFLFLIVSGGFQAGSEELLSFKELDNSSRKYIFRDVFVWNTKFGVMFYSSLYLYFSGYAILFGAQIIGTIRWCSKFKNS